MARSDKVVVRIRIIDNEYAEYCVKSREKGNSCYEFETEINLKQAMYQIKHFSLGVVYKTRYYIPFEGKTWEIDEYKMDHKGKITSEVELCYDGEEYLVPSFIGKCVTSDKSLSNYRMALKQSPEIDGTYISDFNKVF